MAGPEEVGGVEGEERGGEEELEAPAAPAAQTAPDCRGGELPWHSHPLYRQDTPC